MKFKKFLNEYYQEPERIKLWTSSNSLLDNSLKINMRALQPERSYEDRDLYIEIWMENNEKDKETYYSNPDEKITTWLKGEEAIQLGKDLIEIGNKSLEYNRKQTYETIELLAAKDKISKGLISKLIITKKSDKYLANHGEGFCYYNLLYVGRNDLMSRYIEDVIIYWSPFEEEFKKQIQNYSNGIPVEMIGWNWEDIRDKFNKDMEKMNKENGY